MMGRMRIAHPKTEHDFQVRDRLLQASLRDESLPYGIAKEYPLVLSENASQWSWCGFIEDRMVTHINLWPRELRGCRIGLIGNVATALDFRGRGLMQKMFDAMKEQAKDQGLTALVLWSDLPEFYQKLGFRSCGSERRYLFHYRQLLRYRPPHDLEPVLPGKAEQLLPHRYPTANTLARSTSEMLLQLSIPDTHTFAFANGYAIEGRGADLRGVVHEWGASSQEIMLGALHGITKMRGLEHIMLMAPGDLAPEWDRIYQAVALSSEQLPMALGYGESLDDIFIWGLDSI